MFKFSNRALAVTAGFCLMSGAASAQEMHISYRGLDLARPADAAIFKARVDSAATRFCIAYVGRPIDLNGQASCERAISDEAQAKLPLDQRNAFARARQTPDQIVSAQR